MNDNINGFKKYIFFFFLTSIYSALFWFSVFLHKKSFLFIVEKNGFMFYLLAILFILGGNWLINYIVKDLMVNYVYYFFVNPFPSIKHKLPFFRLTFIVVCLVYCWKSLEFFSLIYNQIDFSNIKLLLFSIYMVGAVIYSFFIFINTILKIYEVNNEN